MPHRARPEAASRAWCRAGLSQMHPVCRRCLICSSMMQVQSRVWRPMLPFKSVNTANPYSNDMVPNYGQSIISHWQEIPRIDHIWEPVQLFQHLCKHLSPATTFGTTKVIEFSALRLRGSPAWIGPYSWKPRGKLRRCQLSKTPMESNLPSTTWAGYKTVEQIHSK